MGIRFKLLLPILIGFISFYIVLTQYFTPLYLKNEKSIFKLDEGNLIKTISPSITQSLQSHDLAALFENLDGSMQINQSEWISLTVYDKNNHRIYPLDPPNPVANTKTITIRQSLTLDDVKFGEVLLVVNWEKEKLEKIHIAHVVTYSVIAVFGLITLLSVVWQTIWIRRPIIKLQQAAIRLKENDFDTPLLEGGHDEIGTLGHVFDSMRSTIKTSRLELESALNSAQENELKNRTILATTPDTIITLDAENHITAVNMGAENTFKYKVKDIINQNIAILLDENSAKILTKELNETARKEYPLTIGVSTDLMGLKNNGEKFPVEININKLFLSPDHAYTLVIRDISERKKVDKIKNEFISIVSHELRTPLTAMQGALKLLQHSINHTLNESNSSLLDIAIRNTKRLLMLINDILDISKLESGNIQLHYSEFSVMSFLEQAIVINQSYAKEHNTLFNITEGIDPDILVRTDYDRLMQVMSNLLSNAAKFSPENRPVEVSAKLNVNEVIVKVTDHGSGIPKEFQDKLFDKFTQENSGTTRQTGGTGLGLNISRNLIEHMGGDIGFNSEKGKATEFYFCLPIYSHVIQKQNSGL